MRAARPAGVVFFGGHRRPLRSQKHPAGYTSIGSCPTAISASQSAKPVAIHDGGSVTGVTHGTQTP